MTYFLSGMLISDQKYGQQERLLIIRNSLGDIFPHKENLLPPTVIAYHQNVAILHQFGKGVR